MSGVKTNMVKSTLRLQKWELLIYSLMDLRGIDELVHVEHIAVRAQKILPGAFSWDLEEYSERIDKDRVRRILTQLEKGTVQRPQMVRSSKTARSGPNKKKDYWRLTPDGLEWLIENKERLEISLQIDKRVNLIDLVETFRLAKRLESSQLYSDFKQGNLNSSRYHLADLLECAPDARKEVIRDRFEKLFMQVRLLNDEQYSRFLLSCGRVHHQLLQIDASKWQKP